MIKSFLLSLAFGLALTTIALSHSWYPLHCCNGDDCKPIPCEEISETKDGAEWGGYKFTKERTYPSQDAHCHACISPGGQPYCIFTQQGS